MPPDAAVWSPARLAELAAGLSIELSAVQSDRLIAFLNLLQRWNGTYNLTAVRDPQQMLVQHLGDCLALVPPLRRHLGDDPASRLMDVGSGGGLPGVVLAVMLPQLDVTCVDAVGKKAAFIRQAAAELGLARVHAVHARVEDLKTAPFQLITSRAFASLADFTALTRRHLAPAAVWVAMKGKEPRDEIAALGPDVDVFHVEPLNIPGLDAERCLVWMRPKA